MELAHAVKNHPEDFRHALDARQMVLFFEKASLRTRLTFEAAINTLGGNAIFVDQTQSPLGERESLPDMAHNVERWMSIMVLRTYSHDTITEMAACSKVPVINALSDLRTSLPGHRRLLHPRRALRLLRGPALHLRRRWQQRLPLAHADRRAARRALHRRHAQGLPAQARHHPQGHRDRRSRPAAASPSCRTPSRPSPVPTPSTPTSAPAWASSTKPPSAPRSSSPTRSTKP